MPLPTNRTTANTAAEHVSDHNALAAGYNVDEEFRADIEDRVSTLESSGGSGTHPNAAAHEAMGLVTDADLTAHAGTPGHTHPDLAAHDSLGLATQAELNAHTHAQVQTFAMEGTLVTRTGALKFRFPFAATLLGASAVVGTAPTGASVIVDVNLNGTSVYTTQANRPTIAAGQTVATETTPNTTAVSAGGLLSVDVDQVGSSVAGADLTVMVRYTPA